MGFPPYVEGHTVAYDFLHFLKFAFWLIAVSLAIIPQLRFVYICYGHVHDLCIYISKVFSNSTSCGCIFTSTLP